MSSPGLPPWTLGLPRDQAEIDAIHRARKRVAVERARRSKLLARASTASASIASTTRRSGGRSRS